MRDRPTATPDEVRADESDQPDDTPSGRPGAVDDSGIVVGDTNAEDVGDDAEELQIDVGVLVAHSPHGDPDRLESFARRTARDSVEELAGVTDATWRIHTVDPDPLADATAHKPSEFLDEAAFHMATGPYDLVVVVTDVPVIARGDRSVPGLASPLARVVVLSTNRLVRTHDQGARRSLDSAAVRWNAATLLAHLLGHVFGARHGDGGVMEPFSFDPSRRSVPDFDAEVGNHLRRVAADTSEADVARGTARQVAVHLRSPLRHPSVVLSTLLHSRAARIPILLPRLSTAAVTPTLILVFSAETWDVGLNLSNLTAALFATVSVVAAAVHLLFVQRLTFPREPTQVVTEHMALVNVTVFLVLVTAMTSLFVMVGSIILLIELVIFPPNLMTNWPSLENPAVGLVDIVRIGAFISTLGVLSGALAGGIENRMALRHLALFLDRP